MPNLDGNSGPAQEWPTGSLQRQPEQAPAAASSPRAPAKASATSSPRAGGKGLSKSAAGPQPRILRVEVNGKLHNWFDIDALGPLVRDQSFADTLKDNIERYFGVPIEHQVIYDEDGLLTTAADFSRSLQGVSPKLHIYDVTESRAEFRQEGTAAGGEDNRPDGLNDRSRLLNGVVVTGLNHHQLPAEDATVPTATAGFGNRGCSSASTAMGNIPPAGELEATTPLLPGRTVPQRLAGQGGSVSPPVVTSSGYATPPPGEPTASNIILRQLASSGQAQPPAVWAERRGVPNQYGLLASEACEINSASVTLPGQSSANASVAASPRRAALAASAETLSPRTTWHMGPRVVEVAGLGGSRAGLSSRNATSSGAAPISPGPSRTPRASACRPTLLTQEPTTSAAAGRPPTPPPALSSRLIEPPYRGSGGSQAASGSVTPTYGGASTPPARGAGMVRVTSGSARLNNVDRSPVRSVTPTRSWRAAATVPGAATATPTVGMGVLSASPLLPVKQEAPRPLYPLRQASLLQENSTVNGVSAASRAQRRSVSPAMAGRVEQQAVLRRHLPSSSLLRPSGSQPLLQQPLQQQPLQQSSSLQPVAATAMIAQERSSAASRSSTPVRMANAQAWGGGAPLVMPTPPNPGQLSAGRTFGGWQLPAAPQEAKMDNADGRNGTGLGAHRQVAM